MVWCPGSMHNKWWPSIYLMHMHHDRRSLLSRSWGCMALSEAATFRTMPSIRMLKQLSEFVATKSYACRWWAQSQMRWWIRARIQPSGGCPGQSHSKADQSPLCPPSPTCLVQVSSSQWVRPHLHPPSPHCIVSSCSSQGAQRPHTHPPHAQTVSSSLSQTHVDPSCSPAPTCPAISSGDLWIQTLPCHPLLPHLGKAVSPLLLLPCQRQQPASMLFKSSNRKSQSHLNSWGICLRIQVLTQAARL